MLDLARADAERQRAERAVRRRVAVAADDRHAGQRATLLGPDDVDDALAGIAHRVQRDAELGGVLAQHVDLAGRDRIGDRLVDVGRRHVVVLGGDGELGTPHAATGEPQAVERLRAGHLVDEVQVDVEQVGFAGRRAHDVAVPDLLRQCLGGMGVSHSEIEFLISGQRIERRRRSTRPSAVLRGTARPTGRSAWASCRTPPGCRGPRPTGWRAALERHGLVRARRRRPLLPRPRARAALGRAAADAFPLADIARPALAALREETGESVQLFVRRGRRAALRRVAAVAARSALDRPGGRLLPLARRLGTGRRGLAGERRSTAPGGWVESVEEREAGVASVSAPVVDRAGDVVAAVSVSGPVERLTRAARATASARQVVAAAERLSAALAPIPYARAVSVDQRDRDGADAAGRLGGPGPRAGPPAGRRDPGPQLPTAGDPGGRPPRRRLARAVACGGRGRGVDDRVLRRPLHGRDGEDPQLRQDAC